MVVASEEKRIPGDAELGLHWAISYHDPAGIA
jgi:hypothetical protein